MNLYDLLIFDLDGTLFDNRAAIRANFKNALRANGFPEVSDADVDRTIGHTLEDAFRAAVPGISDQTVGALTASYKASYRTTSHIGIEFLEGVPEVLEKVRSFGIKTAVATTKSNENLNILLERIDLLRHFDMTLGTMPGVKAKPSPEMLQIIMKSVGVPPGRTAMIGDAHFDVLAGRNAGVHTIAVLTGVKLGISSDKELRDANPAVIIDSLKELEGIVRRDVGRARIRR